MALVMFVFTFFAPVLYSPRLFAQSCCSGITDTAGLESIGYAISHWGATYSFNGGAQLWGYAFLPEGYFAFPRGSTLTTFGVLVFLMTPILAAAILLMVPEIFETFRRFL